MGALNLCRENILGVIGAKRWRRSLENSQQLSIKSSALGPRPMTLKLGNCCCKFCCAYVFLFSYQKLRLNKCLNFLWLRSRILRWQNLDAYARRVTCAKSVEKLAPMQKLNGFAHPKLQEKIKFKNCDDTSIIHKPRKIERGPRYCVSALSSSRTEILN